MRIGELASEAGVGVETLRFYERRGLLEEPPRTGSGYRAYGRRAVRRVRFIRRAKELGFTLREIDELLALSCDEGATCGDVRRRAEANVADVEERIRRLAAIRDALVDLAANCHGDVPASDCPLLDRLDRAAEVTR